MKPGDEINLCPYDAVTMNDYGAWAKFIDYTGLMCSEPLTMDVLQQLIDHYVATTDKLIKLRDILKEEI